MVFAISQLVSSFRTAAFKAVDKLVSVKVFGDQLAEFSEFPIERVAYTLGIPNLLFECSCLLFKLLCLLERLCTLVF